LALETMVCPCASRCFLSLFFLNFFEALPIHLGRFVSPLTAPLPPPFALAPGLLDVRLVISRDGTNLTYSSATFNARAPFVHLGVNLCGTGASSPSAPGGWCSPTSGIEQNTTADTSAMSPPLIYPSNARAILTHLPFLLLQVHG
jgi:hypothetical protein